jgi:formate hydrogenlyase subunit 6/NADH:ubiquinone oxidoreductase subunit I
MADFISEDCKGCALCVKICPVDAISGERKQRHVIDPTLCIECDACGFICSLSAVFDSKGQRIQHVKQKDWQKPVWNYKACVACNICIQACPVGVIGQIRIYNKRGAPGRAYPALQDAKNCIACAFCAVECPTDAIEMCEIQLE